MNISSTDSILIVGSGPSGLILALTLVKNGVSVRVIEKERTYRVGQRGPSHTPRTMELFESLGVLQEISKQAVKVPMIRMFKMPGGVEIMKEFSPIPQLQPTSSCPYPNFHHLGQDTLDKILRAELAKFGCKVELGVEFVSLNQFDDRVEVKLHHHSLNDDNSTTEEERTTFKWVIGADGAKSTIRKQMGFSFRGQTTSQNFIFGDLKITGLPADRLCMWGNLSEKLIAIRPTETPGLYNLLSGGALLTNQEEICATEDSVKEYIRNGTGNRDDINIGEIVYMSPFRINIRLTDTFQQRRVFITGDAAHVHSPAGGQGLNTGVQDSYNLGWKLALVAKGLSHPDLLNSYSEERVPVVSEMLGLTTDLLKKISHDSTVEDSWKRPSAVNQLGVNYRGSSITLDEIDSDNRDHLSKGSRYTVEGVGGLRAGDRAPDATGLTRVSPNSQTQTPMRLFDLFSPSRHTAIIFADGIDFSSVLDSLQNHANVGMVKPILITSSELPVAVQSGSVATDVFQDREGHAHNAYLQPFSLAKLFVIRPDGVIGARLSSTKALEDYFSRIYIS